ncbi:MAG: hypothetical protein ACR2FX_01580, partial [Chthoniobacterales bacterium]
DRAGDAMRITLLIGCAGAFVFCAVSALPHLLPRVMLGAAALLGLVHELGRSAPVGYQDEGGFHYARVRRVRRRARRNIGIGLLVSASRPLKA